MALQSATLASHGKMNTNKTKTSINNLAYDQYGKKVQKCHSQDL